MNEIKKCFKCGTTEGTIIEHHLDYKTDVTVCCCRSCHKKIHNKIRREKKCPFTPEQVDKLSKLSNRKRYRNKYQRCISFHETLGENILSQEQIWYNTKNGTVVYSFVFVPYGGKKLLRIDI